MFLINTTPLGTHKTLSAYATFCLQESFCHNLNGEEEVVFSFDGEVVEVVAFSVKRKCFFRWRGAVWRDGVW